MRQFLPRTTLTAFLLLQLLFFGGLVHEAHAATASLKIDPAQGTFFVGSTFDVSLILDTGGETVNAIEAELRFPPQLLQVTSPTAARSVISIWASPPTYSNQEGFVRFQGGVPAPGLKTSSGVLSVVSFRAVQPGEVTLNFSGNSRVLLADGRGTNILGTTFGARYRIAIPPPQGPTVSSPTHPDYIQWYKNTSPTFSWQKDEGVSEFSWILDNDPNGVPDTKSDGTQTALTHENLEDGLWYFHIRANKSGVWGGITTFLAKIDSTPPAEFTMKVDPSTRFAPGTRALIFFNTTDALSGISRYELKIVDVSGPEAVKKSPFFIEVESPFVLPELEPGVYTVIIRAYDAAGTFFEASQQFEVRIRAISFFSNEGLRLGPVTAPWWMTLGGAVFAFAIGALAAFVNWRRHARVQARASTSVGELRARLQTDLEKIHARLREDEALRERFGERFKTLNGALAKPKPKETSPTTKFPLFFIGFVLVAFTLLFISLLPVDAAAAITSPPRILSHDVSIATNQLLYLSGVSEPSSQVRISIRGGQQEPIIAQTRANERGDWEYLHGLYLQPGLYEVSVETLDSVSGAVIAKSDPVAIRVANRSINIGKYVIEFDTLLGLLVLLFFNFATILIGVVIYFRMRTSRVHTALKKEVREIHEVLRLGFTFLRKELERDLAVLEKAARHGDRELSSKERELRNTLLADLQEIEERIEREVVDVEELV